MSSGLPLLSTSVLGEYKPKSAAGGTCMFSFTSTLMVVGGILTTLAVILALSGGGGVGGAVMSSVIWGLVVNLVVSGIYAMTCKSAPGSATYVLAGLVLVAAALMFATRPQPAATTTTTTAPAKADVYTRYAEDDITDPGPNYVPTIDAPERTHGPQ